MIRNGLDLHPKVHETGRRVGELFGRDLPVSDLQDWVRKAAHAWQLQGLGRLMHNGTDPTRLHIEACRSCCQGEANRVRLCQITAGLLEGMACESLGSNVEVKQSPPRRRRADQDERWNSAAASAASGRVERVVRRRMRQPAILASSNQFA